MAVSVRRLGRDPSSLETRREEFFLTQEAKRAEDLAEVSPFGVVALITIFGLGAFWVTGVFLWVLIQFLPGLG